MLRVLFAHPDQKLASIYTRHIKEHFFVDSAHDGLSAFRKLKLVRPSLVISDYDLPIISGLSLLRFMRNSETFAAIPFIFLSNYHDNTEALSMGANDWLEIKSIAPEIMLDRIHHHIKLNKHALQIN